MTCEAYAYRGAQGIDIDTIAESPAIVRDKILEQVMGWKYQYPGSYSHEEAWQRILETGEVVTVSVSESVTPTCECHERDSSYVCDYCRSKGSRGHMQT